MLIPSEPLNVSFDARLPVTLPSYLLSLPSLLSALPPSLVCLLSLAVLSEISSSSRQPLESTAVASTDTASSVRNIFSLVFLISSPFLLAVIITIFSHINYNRFSRQLQLKGTKGIYSAENGNPPRRPKLPKPHYSSHFS